MLPRVLEPEVMDTAEEAADYDAMDHSGVNRVFVGDFVAAFSGQRSAISEDSSSLVIGDSTLLDVGTGTALIPIELASRELGFRITAIDLAEEMLWLGRRNVERAGYADCISLELVDAKRMPYADGTFDAVMSNSIVHHIPEPLGVLAEMWRVLKPGGLLFVRDLLRPETADEVERIVATYAGSESPRQQQLFRQSLHAALTVEEVGGLLAAVVGGRPAVGRLARSGDRPQLASGDQPQLASGDRPQLASEDRPQSAPEDRLPPGVDLNTPHPGPPPGNGRRERSHSAADTVLDELDPGGHQCGGLAEEVAPAVVPDESAKLFRGVGHLRRQRTVSVQRRIAFEPCFNEPRHELFDQDDAGQLVVQVLEQIVLRAVMIDDRRADPHSLAEVLDDFLRQVAAEDHLDQARRERYQPLSDSSPSARFRGEGRGGGRLSTDA